MEQVWHGPFRWCARGKAADRRFCSGSRKLLLRAAHRIVYRVSNRIYWAMGSAHAPDLRLRRLLSELGLTVERTRRFRLFGGPGSFTRDGRQGQPTGRATGGAPFRAKRGCTGGRRFYDLALQAPRHVRCSVISFTYSTYLSLRSDDDEDRSRQNPVERTPGSARHSPRQTSDIGVSSAFLTLVTPSAPHQALLGKGRSILTGQDLGVRQRFRQVVEFLRSALHTPVSSDGTVARMRVFLCCSPSVTSCSALSCSLKLGRRADLIHAANVNWVSLNVTAPLRVAS